MGANVRTRSLESMQLKKKVEFVPFGKRVADYRKASLKHRLRKLEEIEMLRLHK